MRRLIFAALISISCFSLIAQTSADNSENTLKEGYCTSLKNGKLVVVRNGIQLKSEVALANGSRITPDAAIVKKDGTRIPLVNGQCVDKEGMVINPRVDKTIPASNDKTTY